MVESGGDRLAWLARYQTGSEFGCSRRAILVEPQQTGWHSWQSGGDGSALRLISRAQNTPD